MATHDWVEEFPGEITVCDPEGIVLEMNVKAGQTFESDGGRAFIGKNLLDCHPEAARAKLEQLMQSRQTNVYTIEKRGVKKLVYQTPWYRDGVYGGMIEVELEIPFEMPHFIREG